MGVFEWWEVGWATGALARRVAPPLYLTRKPHPETTTAHTHTHTARARTHRCASSPTRRWRASTSTSCRRRRRRPAATRPPSAARSRRRSASAASATASRRCWGSCSAARPCGTRCSRARSVSDWIRGRGSMALDTCPHLSWLTLCLSQTLLPTPPRSPRHRIHPRHTAPMGSAALRGRRLDVRAAGARGRRAAAARRE